MIAEETGSYLFAIESEQEYPLQSYRELLDVAKAEQDQNARPKLKADVQNFDSYDTIYLGYPIWWGGLPMPLYTFMEAHNWSGKTVFPFCTHEGSGLSGTEAAIRSSCKGASVRSGLAVRGSTAQNDKAATRSAVKKWLNSSARADSPISSLQRKLAN